MATTLGETAGNTVRMTFGLGYLIGTAIFLAVLVVMGWRPIAATRFRVLLY